MILSGHDIRWYIEKKKLVIDGVTDSQFQQNGVDLCLRHIERSPNDFSKGEFYLGVHAERIKMPDDLMAFVELRSTWARRGLMIPPTIIDAGFEGDITLEVVSFCSQKVPYFQRFAHVVFAKLTNPAEPYRGKYQGQVGITGPIEDTL